MALTNGSLEDASWSKAELPSATEYLTWTTTWDDQVCAEPTPREKPTEEVLPTPYVKGAKLRIYRHIPPEPVDDRYFVCKKVDIDEQAELTFSERSVLHPPLPGTTLEAEATSIVITDEIAVNDNHGAQVVGVESDFGNLVAKFYEPRYYPIPTRSNDVGGDQFRSADYEYSREAAAYQKLSGPFGGTIVPKYHGSYTCELPYPGNTTRSVRLILMERIPGICMLDLDPTRPQLPQRQRANVMAKIVGIESTLAAFGLCQRDLHPRNIMLCGNDFGSESLRVVFIDFGHSKFVEDVEDIVENGRPVSPVLTWHVRAQVHRQFQEHGWIDWNWQEWLEERWLGSDAYAPITENAKHFWLGFRLNMKEEEYASWYLPTPPPSV